MDVANVANVAIKPLGDFCALTSLQAYLASITNHPNIPRG